MTISTRQLGERIADARQRRGWTQAAAAEAVGIARTTWIAVEKGERRPSEAELVRVAAALQVELRQLLHPHVVLASAAPRFRSQRGAQRSALLEAAVVEVEDLARRYVELERLLGFERSLAPLELVNRWAAGSLRRGADARQAGGEAARMVRSMLGVGEGPLHGLQERMESAAGLRVFHLQLPPGIAAFLFWSEEAGAVVAMEARHPYERRRFSLAHEVGHFLRDREAGDVLPAGGPGQVDEGERFADAFAVELLMPEHGIRLHFHELVGGRAGSFTLADVLAMADLWKVSFQAMTLRLEELGSLPAGTFERVRTAGFRPERGRVDLGRTRPERTPGRIPDRYVDLAIAAWERELLSEGELADHLGVDRLEVRRIVDERRLLSLDDGTRMSAALGEDVLGAAGT